MDETGDDDMVTKQAQEEEEQSKLEESLEEDDEEDAANLLEKDLGKDTSSAIIKMLKTMPQDISYVIGQFVIPKPVPSANKIITSTQEIVYHFKKRLLEEAVLGMFKLTTQLRRLFTIEPVPENKSIPFKISGLSKNVKDEISRWEVMKNDGRGDCFFEALAYILNNNDNSKNPIVPRSLNVETGNMDPIQGNNPYLTTGDAPRYNVYRLRKAVADYLRVDPTSIETLIATAPENLTELVKKETRINKQAVKQSPDSPEELLTDIEEQDIRSYKWMLNRTNTELMEMSKIIDVMEYPQNPSNRTGTINKIMKKKKLAYLASSDSYGKYYWGDQIALITLEKVFNIKFCPLYLTKALKRNGRVSFKHDGQITEGVIKKITDDSYTIVTDLYEEYQKPKSNVMPLESVELYPFGSSLVPDENTQVAFLYYTHENVGGGHYEALSKKRFTERYANITLFVQDKLPSYISFCIFKSICGFTNDGLFSFLHADSSYLKFPRTPKNSLFKVINSMYNIYTAAEPIQVDDTEMDKEMHTFDKTPKQLAVQFGGTQQEVRKYLQTYLQNSKGVDAKNTYYVVIDLNLFPDTGQPLSMLDKFRLRCGNTKDRIREATADAFGLYYVPGEMDTSRFKEDVPMPVAVPIEERETRNRTEKQPSAPNTTRKNGGGLPRKRGSIKRHIRPRHKTRRFFYPY
jgi:hypothetical protein